LHLIRTPHSAQQRHTVTRVAATPQIECEGAVRLSAARNVQELQVKRGLSSAWSETLRDKTLELTMSVEVDGVR